MATEEGQVFACHSEQEFAKKIAEGKDSGKVIAIDFTATWCGPCRFIGPIFAEYAKKHINIIFLKIDVDELESIAKKYTVDAMPTFVFIKDGEEIDRLVGARKDELLSKVKSLSALTA